MVIKDFKTLGEMAALAQKRTVAVACAHDGHTLEAVLKAEKEGLLDYILVGRKEEILEEGKKLGTEIPGEKVIHCETDAACAQKAVELIHLGEADFLQKGMMQTADLLRAVVNKEKGIGTGRPISHVALVDIPGYHKVIGVTDGGMILYPDLEKKKAITVNAVEMFRGFGYEKPKVAAVCAVEVVNAKMPETVDAGALKEMVQTGEITDCILEGPISMDLAVSKEAAEIKKYHSPVAGDADILVVPNIYSGNMMVKALLEFANAKMAGCVVGAQCPIALNSRSSSFEEKYYSLLACSMMAKKREKTK